MVIPLDYHYNCRRVEERRLFYALCWEMGPWYAQVGVHPNLQAGGFDTFFGYYNAVEDYYDHSFGDADNRKFNAVDFRNNTKPVTDKNGTYSTMLFTEAVEQIE